MATKTESRPLFLKSVYLLFSKGRAFIFITRDRLFFV
jgi:hypothetical protein